MKTKPVILSIALALTFAAPAAAQNEGALKDFFEGRRVTLRLDMPGTSSGVNVHPDARRDLDFGRYRDDLRRYGPALRAGETAMVTLVKVKGDLIEFQLNGGGFGTLFDDTSTSVYIPFLQKSERERALEQCLREETNWNRRRQLQRELDGLRDYRDRENRRIQFERERLSIRKQEHVAMQRMNGGARFNIRYEGRVPYNLCAEDIMAALGEYVEFGGSQRRGGR